MSEYVAALDVWITQEKMPLRVRAFCKEMGGENHIVINEELADEKKYEAVAHEMQHFSRNDLRSEASVSEIEARRLQKQVERVFSTAVHNKEMNL